MSDTSVTDPVVSPDIDPVDWDRGAPDQGPPRPSRPAPWHVRLGLTWSSGSSPVVLLLLLGLALGPQGLAVLTPSVLSAIDPALPVALAALGVQVAIALPIRRVAGYRQLLAGASLEALVTGAAVMAGSLLLMSDDPAAPTFHAWTIALAAGICAAMSTGLSSDTLGVTASTAAMRQMDVLLPAVAGGFLLAWVREGAGAPATLLMVQSALLAVVVAGVAWLLLSRTSSENEQRIFSGACLLLLGGLADYLSLSALLGGLVTGALLQLGGGQSLEAMRRDTTHIQPPLLVLLLVVAGARTQLSMSLVGLMVAYPLLRTAGKLAGAWIVRRSTRPIPPRDLGMALVYPGVFGIAFAVNVVRAAGPQSDALLSIVVVGSLICQMIASRRGSEQTA